MQRSWIRTICLLGLAMAAPGIVAAQSAPAAPPADPTSPVAPLALPSLPAEQESPAASPRPSAAAAPARATTRARVAQEALAPSLASPAWSPSGMLYSTQNGPYYRYAVPGDKEMQELVKKESELAKKTSELVATLRTTAADKKAEIRTQLVASVEEHFGVRQAQRELQLKRIEEEVKKLREAIEKRNTSKKEIIERRIAELTGEDTIGF